MSTTTTTHETVSTDIQTSDNSHNGLAEIVAQTTPLGDELPDFNEFNAVCKETKRTIERVIDQETI